jgi:lambda family phage tail tape measure protein
MRDLAKSHAAVEADANAHMGPVLDWWHQFEYTVTRAKNAIMSIGTPVTIDKQVGDQFAKVEAAQRNLDQMRGGSQFSVEQAKQELAVEMEKLNVLRAQQTTINTTQRAREAAAKSGDAKVAVTSYLNSDKYANPAQKQSNELQAENEAFKKATASLTKDSTDYQSALKRHFDNVAQINVEYAKKTRVHGDAGAFAGQIAAMTAANQLIEAEEKRHETTLKAQRQLGLIDGETYLTQLAGVQERALDQEIANAQKRVDIAKGKPESAAYQEALKDLQKYKDQRNDIERGLNDSLAQLQQQRARDVERYAMQAARPREQQGAAYAVEDATRFSTPREVSEYGARFQAAQQYAQQMRQLWEQYALDPASDQKAYALKVQYQQTAYDQQMQQLQDHMQREQQVRGSYSDQMHLAITQLGGDGQTNAQLVASAFSTAWQDSASALEQFVTTGKGSFSQFTASILADMAKIALHQAEMQIFQSIGTSFFSTGGPVGHYADGGAIVGAGTGTSDSIPALLSNGEYVINAASTKKYRGLLESINHGQMAHLASGGIVGSVAPATGGGSSSAGGDLHFHLDGSGRGGLTAEDAKALLPVFQAFVDKRLDQKFRGQGGYSYQLKYGQI